MSLKSDTVDKSVSVNGSISIRIDDIALNHSVALIELSLGKKCYDGITLSGEPLVVIVVVKLGSDG